VTADAAVRPAALRIFARRYRRLRTAHPVIVLEWLRNSVLVCVLAAASLYLWVATQASNDIGAAGRTAQAVADIGKASTAAKDADRALGTEFKTEDVTLTGTGGAYVDDLTAVDKDLTLAAEDNAAGPEGTEGIQFVQDELATYLQLSENAVLAYGAGKRFGQIMESNASGSDQDIGTALVALRSTEATALRAQRGAWPLDPAAFWWALLGPVAGILLLTVATAQVLARHFRRHVSRWLWGSLLVTAATVVIVGVFNWNDERHLSADPWAGHPATLTAALVLFFLAAVLAQLAYHPRLAEYRFESS
jgi:hypothetical protein